MSYWASRLIALVVVICIFVFSGLPGMVVALGTTLFWLWFFKRNYGVTVRGE